MPSINTSSARTRGIAQRLMTDLGMDRYSYRKMLSGLRANSCVTERYLTDKKTEKIQYPAVPAGAMLKYRQSFEKQDGIAFFLIYFTGLNEFYYLPFRKLKEFWDRAANGGRKSFRRDELSDDFIISTPGEEGILIPYLDLIQKDLDER